MRRELGLARTAHVEPKTLVRSNSTRWNSVYAELECALKVKNQFQEFLESEFTSHSQGRSDEDEYGISDVIKTDLLMRDDWEIIAQYKMLLEPCFDASRELEGRPGANLTVGLSNVMSNIECIVEELTIALMKYEHAPQDAIGGEFHFSTQIRLALDKAKTYYAKLDDSPAYLASAVLHPNKNWEYITRMWSTRQAWLRSGKQSLARLWATYKHAPVSEAISPKKKSLDDLSATQRYRQRGKAPTAPKVVEDELQSWMKRKQLTEEVEPIAWWHTHGRMEYPHLAQMAFDLLSIPAMSDEPERIFSRTGIMITKYRNKLQQDIVQATTCLHSWDLAGFVNMLHPYEAAQSPSPLPKASATPALYNQ